MLHSFCLIDCACAAEIELLQIPVDVVLVTP